MDTMHESLARDRIRQAHERSRRNAVAREVAATRRWRRLSALARAAEARHAARVRQVGAAR